MSAMRTGNLYDDARAPAEGERFDTLLSHGRLHIERIVSSATPEPGTYVQPQDEWVLLVRGEARLRIDGEAMALRAGDHLFLPAGVPHTVEATSGGALWLAVHLYPDARPEPDAAPSSATTLPHRAPS